jgi:hypothetical protein
VADHLREEAYSIMPNAVKASSEIHAVCERRSCDVLTSGRHTTHDIIELESAGETRGCDLQSYTTAGLASTRRWRFDDTPVDLWGAPDGEVWPPYKPQSPDGGNTWAFERDLKGRVFAPKPLWLAVSPGSSARTETEECIAKGASRCSTRSC